MALLYTHNLVFIHNRCEQKRGPERVAGGVAGAHVGVAGVCVRVCVRTYVCVCVKAGMQVGRWVRGCVVCVRAYV